MSEEITNTENTSPETAAEPAETEQSAPQQRERRSPRQNDSDDNRKDGKPTRSPRFKKKVCKFCHNKDLTIDYKNSDLLEKFLTERGKILPRRITGTCAKHQRHIATEVKRARMIALLPFVEQ